MSHSLAHRCSAGSVVHPHVLKKLNEGNAIQLGASSQSVVEVGHICVGMPVGAATTVKVLPVAVSGKVKKLTIVIQGGKSRSVTAACSLQLGTWSSGCS